MLIPKKIEKNKLIFYISVIIVMIGGTGFFLYKNYSLTSASRPVTMEAPAETVGGSEPSLNNLLGKEIELKEEESTPEGKEVVPAVPQPSESKDLLNLDLLSDSKFKRLREPSLGEADFIVGKSNPFAPD